MPYVVLFLKHFKSQHKNQEPNDNILKDKTCSGSGEFSQFMTLLHSWHSGGVLLQPPPNLTGKHEPFVLPPLKKSFCIIVKYLQTGNSSPKVGFHYFLFRCGLWKHLLHLPVGHKLTPIQRFPFCRLLRAYF